ncbi:MAG TPA: hypothetical protein VJ576_22015 [Rhodocyclaceae bacterium]|nr:hypothetical protein [Rhodocyclaceae bacterium]
MNLELERRKARILCADRKIAVLPYGNAWWLLGHGVSQVVGELAGLSHSHLNRFQATQR